MKNAMIRELLRKNNIAEDIRGELEELNELINHAISVQPKLEDAVIPISADRMLVIRCIEDAFRAVTCFSEKTVLLACEAGDLYASEETIDMLSEYEERSNWQNISPQLLSACDCALSYAGPEAFRFLIPAYMMNALRYPILQEFSLNMHFYHQENLSERLMKYTKCQHSMLNNGQKNAISAYLNQSWWEILSKGNEVEYRFESRGLTLWEFEEYIHKFSYMSIREYERYIYDKHLNWIKCQV